MGRKIAISTRLQIDGEKEYKQALASVNSSLKVINSEMALTSQKFDANSKSTEALTEKGKLLGKQLDAQEQKVKTLRDALENAKNAKETDQKAIDRWQISLNNAEKELIKTKSAVEQNDEALKASQTDTEKLGDAVDNITQKFGVSLPGGLKESMNGLGDIDTATVVTAGKFAALAIAVGTVATKLEELTVKQAGNADNILTQSTVTGISTDALQEYNYAAELLDVSVDTLTGSQTKMIRAMSSAQDGSKKQAEAFETLGVKITGADGKLRDSQDVFWESIDALGKMRNETERDATAMEIFGKSARELNPLIEAGSSKMKEFAQEAHDAGYVFSEEELKVLGAVDDAKQRFNNSVDEMEKRISLQMAPAVESFLTSGASLFVKIGDAAEESGVVAVFGSVLEILSSMEPVMDMAIIPAFKALGVVLKPVAATLGFTADALTVITSLLASIPAGIGGLFTGDFSDFNKYAGNIQGVFDGTNSATARMMKTVGFNADGTDYWRGGLTWVGEKGPELLNLPTGTSITPAGEVGGDTYYITIDAKSVREFNDIVRMAKSAGVDRRKQ